MGAVLVRSAFSANIKERRDCSTALFDAGGRMIAQAEHIPVHLGAMPDAVAAVMGHDPASGEVWAINDPYEGGTHLPDITLVSRTEVGFAVLPNGRYEARDVLEPIEGELELRAVVTIDGDEIRIDFDGTSQQHSGNLNCPLAVARSACFYVVRMLVDPDIPASGGAFAPVTVTAPEGCLVNARPPAAVAAGNVETSSRIVDVVLRAFGEAVDVPAQGQGTMNNVTVGNESFTYYETIGGGQGACPGADGPSGVHVAMSNTQSTPVEALELQYPLRVRRYELRRGSGGSGNNRGGNGVVRELEALA